MSRIYVGRVRSKLNTSEFVSRWISVRKGVSNASVRVICPIKNVYSNRKILSIIFHPPLPLIRSSTSFSHTHSHPQLQPPLGASCVHSIRRERTVSYFICLLTKNRNIEVKKAHIKHSISCFRTINTEPIYYIFSPHHQKLSRVESAIICS